MHRSKIVCAFDPANFEFAILVAVHPAVFANNHARDIFRALNVRDVERFNSCRESRQLESLLHLFEHTLHVGFEHTKALLKSELCVLLNQIDHVALLAALRHQDVNTSSFAFAQRFFESCRRAADRNKTAKLWRMPVEFRQNHRHSPDEHSGIPPKVTFANERFGQVNVRFFAKSNHLK